MSHNEPRILSKEEMPASEAKWITLKKIKYSDQEGKEPTLSIKRIWESAERKTRKSIGVDGVAIFAVLRSKSNAFPLSTVVIEQFRPPVGKYIIELPAGLIDEGETVEEAAKRELYEETGYTADDIMEVSPVVVSDPGLTNANMQLVVLNVVMEDELTLPKPNLDPGEFIVTKVVEIAKLNAALEDYNEKGFVVDARLSHLASGLELAKKLQI
uniref:Nudix hydrolase domain-containing protein n=1 Tax=Psilocybe cubensis TaxID=181762 RepID=A0A8H7Y2H3_PSICU